MKTVLIYDQCGQEPIKFYVLEGNYSHLDGVYINEADSQEHLQDELSNLMYTEKGRVIPMEHGCFPTHEVKNGAPVIVAGFLP